MSAFNNMMRKTRDRNWGGTNVTVACEPYISGYAYVKWNIPLALWNFHVASEGGGKIIHDVLPKNNQTITTDQESINQILSAACTSVTPPSGTLNKVSFATLGGGKWAVPGSVDYGNNITLKYTEFSGLPIFRIHRTWCRMIRDNKIGLTGLAGDRGHSTGTTKKKYNKEDYSATLLYWTTKPDGVTVEYYAAYSGVFPLKDPMDLFNGDINSVDKLEIDIDYNVDMIWHEDWVYKMCQRYAESEQYGASYKTLWSTDGYRYGQNGANYNTSFNSTPSIL